MDNLVRWSATGSIPPHSIRALRVLWDSNICWVPGTPPASIQDIVLTVRVGTVTRTEDIRLFYAVALSGNKGPSVRDRAGEPSPQGSSWRPSGKEPAGERHGA